jgi:uncharacterized protein (DUF1330 family)
MPKGYLMANLRVDDPEIFKQFSSVALPLIEKFGGHSDIYLGHPVFEGFEIIM